MSSSAIDLEASDISSKKSAPITKATLPEKLLHADTLVLLEYGRKPCIRAQALFRILKLLGGKGRSFGFLAHIAPLNLFYRIIAHSRHLFG